MTTIANASKQNTHVGVVARSLALLSLVVGLALPGSVVSPRVAPASSAEKAAAHSTRATHLVSPNYARFADNLRRWDKQTVTVYVDAASEEGKTPEQTAGLVAQGIALWNGNLGYAIHLQPTTNAAEADINLSFVTAGTLAGGAIGRTDVTFRLDDQVLTHASIHIDRRLPSAELIQVAAHELGHALGIQGHSPDKRDLMYAYAHLPAEITDRDVNTMAVSYNVASASVAANTNTSNDSDSAAEFPTSR